VLALGERAAANAAGAQPFQVADAVSDLAEETLDVTLSLGGAHGGSVHLPDENGLGVRRASDETCAAAVRSEAHRPADEHEDPVLEADEIEEMDDEPREPRDEAAQAEALDVCDGGSTADRREVALVAVAERLARLPA
jgi:hypothetical protein